MKDKKPLPQTQNYLNILKSIDGFFSNAFKNFHHNGMFLPVFPVKTYETKTEFIIEAELPGVEKERIHLDFYQQHVRISVKNEELLQEQNDDKRSFSERHTVQVSEQVVSIPFHVTERDAKATFQNGLLKIKFPNKRKSIPIE